MLRHRLLPSALFSLLLMLLLASCGSGGSTYRIEGTFHDMPEGMLFIYNGDEDNARIDTIYVKDGSFIYTGTTSDVAQLMLVFPNGTEQVIFADGGQTLKYEATANDLKNYVVNGSDENKLMNSFRTETYSFTAEQTRRTARRYIDENLASPVALYLYDRYFVQDATVSAAEMRELTKMLLDKHPGNYLLLGVNAQLENRAHAAVGQKLPPLKLTDRNGHTVDLAHLTQPHTLIAVWASWKEGEWDFTSTLHRLHDEVPGLEIVAISLDTEIYKWEEFVMSDSLAIHHVCHGNAWEEPFVKQMGIRILPSYIIADKTGKIVASGTGTESMKREALRIGAAAN